MRRKPIPTALTKSKAPNIGYIRPIILSIGKIVESI